MKPYTASTSKIDSITSQLISLSERYKVKGRIASIIFLLLGVISVYQYFKVEEYYYLLFGLRDLMTSIFFLLRNKAIKKSNISDALLAYASTALPLFYFKSSYELEPQILFICEVLLIVGITIVTLATLDLGKSNGIQPAKRVLIDSGFYRIVNHPMYMGYCIAQISFIIKNHHNIWIYIISIGLFTYRAKKENLILRGHN